MSTPTSQTASRSRVLRPRARLMMTLGSELISSEAVAIAELVKNSFDADASAVLIRLTGPVDENGAVSKDDARLELLDDGHGMSARVIRRTWLEPATSYRGAEKKSPKGRRVLGEKGVGRFASAKIGSHLQMTSRAKNKSEIAVEIDWTAFEDPESFLDEIEIDLIARKPQRFGADGPIEELWREMFELHSPKRSEAVPPSAETGTSIQIASVRSDWNADLVNEVRRALARLVSPHRVDADSGPSFRILLDLPPSFGISSGFVESPEALTDPPFHLTATVDASGNAVISIDGTELESTTHSTTLHRANEEEGPLRCGPFHVDLGVFNRDANSLNKLLAGGTTVKSIRKDLDEASGVSVYRDGFRVLPYGDAGDDWLGLDLRRVQSPTRRVSNNQVVGHVRIGRDLNPDLLDQTNREGLVSSPSFEDLRSAILQLLNVLETERYKTRPRREKQTRGGLLDRVDLTELKDAITDAIPKDNRIKDMVAELQIELDDRNEKVGEVLARYHRLATLGQLVDRVIHELGQPIAAIGLAVSSGLKAVDRFRKTSSAAAAVELADSTEKRLERIGSQIRVANDVVRRIAPLGSRRRGRPQEYEIEAAIRDVVELLREDINQIGAEIDLPSGSTHVTVDGTELQEILVNLLSNSIHWLKKVDRKKRRIRIDVGSNPDGSLSLVVEDSGPGVPEAEREHIFDPYFTTREGGVGLGLAIAGEIVTDYYGGTLELLPGSDLGGARFCATLRRRVGVT